MSGTPTSDVEIGLGDGSHAHAWESVGADQTGAHEVVCECGATGYGYGDFPPASAALAAYVAAKKET